jgi:hypothetical protein
MRKACPTAGGAAASLPVAALIAPGMPEQGCSGDFGIGLSFRVPLCTVREAADPPFEPVRHFSGALFAIERVRGEYSESVFSGLKAGG